MKTVRRYLLLWTCLILSTGLGSAQLLKIAPDLLNLITGLLQPVNVIVQYNSAPSLLDLTTILTLGGTINLQFTSIPGISVTLPATAVTLLAATSSVAYISPDRKLIGSVDLTTASANGDVAYQSGFTGAGVGIAIIDSGIYAHPDLAGRVVYHQSFITSKNTDDYGHGTHVAGIAAGSGASSTGTQFTQTFRGGSTQTE